ncbi:tobamovirus multiplication protein 1-like isoform X3 [Bidens hawaiensis]
MVLLDLPGLLFFSTYTLLVLFWAEIYHQARSLPADRLRPAYFIVNGAVYFIQMCIWVYMKFSDGPFGIKIAEIFFSVISLCAAIGFVEYGGSLFVMLRRFPIESIGRQKKLHEVGFVTGICCTCFLIRCVMVSSNHPRLVIYYEFYFLFLVFACNNQLFLCNRLLLLHSTRKPKFMLGITQSLILLTT